MDQEGRENIVANMLGRLKKNYCTVSTSDYGSLIRREICLHNTKRVTSDKVQQAEREKEQNYKHLQGTVVSVNEVWHHILNYPEVITDQIVFIIQTTLLEKRSGKSLQNTDKQQVHSI